MPRPSAADLKDELARAARGLARVLAEAGHRAWIVGGAPRDLVLGRSPHEIDLASAALPEEVEALFERTHPVGKAFGTVIVGDFGVDVEVTTFRSDGAYGDARRPDHVAYGDDPAEDAQRRDFTCNALYLDPLTDALFDPTGGLADLEAGFLRCVGDPHRRFREDGLRLWRLARFTAELPLTPARETLAAVTRELDSLRGVSAERVLKELTRLFGGTRAARGVEVALSTGLYARALPAPAAAERVVPAFEALGAAPGVVRGLALAFTLADGEPREPERARGALEDLRASRETRRGVLAALSSAAEVADLARALATPGGRARVPARRERRVLRADSFADGCAVAAALAFDDDAFAATVDGLRARRASLGERELFPAPLLTAADLARSGLPRGPRWSALLAELEDRQLDGELLDRDAALAWLERAVERADGER